VNVRATGRAQREIVRAALWWKTNQPEAPGLFLEEPEAAERHLSATGFFMAELERALFRPFAHDGVELVLGRGRVSLEKLSEDLVQDPVLRRVPVCARWGRGGLYLMDEPESALSASRQLTLVALIHRWVNQGNCQVVIATHSPLLLAYPDALIYELDERGIRTVQYEDAGTVRVYREFLSSPSAFMASLTKEREGDAKAPSE
jgi:hypothetical protein